jgi:hypothetical protein
MKRSIIIALAAVLSAIAFIPSAASACDGSCSGGANTSGTWRHHGAANQAVQPGAGEGLNNGINLSLDQNQQNHNSGNGKGGLNRKHRHEQNS